MKGRKTIWKDKANFAPLAKELVIQDAKIANISFLKSKLKPLIMKMIGTMKHMKMRFLG